MGRAPAKEGIAPRQAQTVQPTQHVSNEPERSVASGAKPKIKFDHKEYDFGDSIGVDKIDHIFTFRNEGDADLVVDKVTTTCGCTAALVSEKVIPPGKTGEIKTTFTFGGRKGKQTKSIYVYSNDPSDSKVTLTITGNIVPPFDVEPASVMLRDSGDMSSKTVKISQTMPEELSVIGIEKKLNMVETALKEEPPVDGKKRYSLEISLKSDVPVGQHFETITVITNSSIKPRTEIPVRISILGDIQANPSRIYLGSVSPGQEIVRQFTVTNSKGKPFAIESVEVDNKDFKVTPDAPLKAAVSHAFTLSGISRAESGGVRAKVVIRTDYPKQEVVEVSAYGYVRKGSPTSPTQMPAP